MPYTVLYNPTSGSGIDAAGEVGYLMHADTLDYVDIIRHGHSVPVPARSRSMVKPCRW